MIGNDERTSTDENVRSSSLFTITECSWGPIGSCDGREGMRTLLRFEGGLTIRYREHIKMWIDYKFGVKHEWLSRGNELRVR